MSLSYDMALTPRAASHPLLQPSLSRHRLGHRPTCSLPSPPSVELPKLVVADVTIIWAYFFARALSTILISPSFAQADQIGNVLLA